MRLYVAPRSLPIEGWSEWTKAVQEQFPIQYFLREAVSSWVRVNISWPLRQLRWAIQHRIIPRHQYHIIKPRSLKPGYHEADTRIRAAAFDILSEYAEERLMGDGVEETKWTQADIDQSSDEWGEKSSILNQVKTEARIIVLRNWWVNERPARIEPDFHLDPKGGEDDMMWPIGDKYKDTPEYKAFKEWSDVILRLEEKWAEEDAAKFKELVDLLPNIWY